MTMSDSPITDAITDAFARFDATPRDLPQDAEELQKRIRFNPHLHPRMPDGRFAPKPGGKPKPTTGRSSTSPKTVPQPNDTKAIVRNQKAEYDRLGEALKDEEGKSIGNPENWSPGHRVVLQDGSYIGRDEEYPHAFFTDEPGGGMNYDVTPDDIFEFARNKQPR